MLLRDGEIIATPQEERFSPKKGDDRFPRHAVDSCLGEAGITVADLAHVGFQDKPLLKFERILETNLAVAPRWFRSFLMAGPLWVPGSRFDRIVPHVVVHRRRGLPRAPLAGMFAPGSAPSGALCSRCAARHRIVPYQLVKLLPRGAQHR